MQIAVLSGKGGTGKTFISTNLAITANKCTYIDCDVEEPNGNLFFKTQNIIEENVNILLPKIDLEKCIRCRKCVDFCKFNAMAFINNKPKIFNNICHSCGACKIICDKNAITEYEYRIGKIKQSKYKDINIYSGELDIGETRGIPIIKELLKKTSKEELNIIDCPPGTACSVVESIQDVDYCLIVAEPTIFGKSNFEMVYELVKLLKKPFGVIINKYIDENNPMEEYLKNNNIPIISKIPFDSKIANLTSKGLIASKEDENLRNKFKQILLEVGGV